MKSVIIISIVIVFGIGIGLSLNVSAEEGLIPSWIKNTASFWVDGNIGDSEFLSALQFLVKEGILVIDQPTSSQSTSIQQEYDDYEYDDYEYGDYEYDDYEYDDYEYDDTELIQSSTQSTIDSSSTTQKAKAVLDYALQLQDSGEEKLIEGAPIDGYPVAYYDVSGDNIVLKNSPSLPPELRHWQTDTEKHMAIWNLFIRLIPESQRNVNELFIAVDGIGGVSAGVNRDANDVSQWQMFYDVSDAFKTDTFDEKDLIYSTIHEHGHIVTSGPDQLDVDVELVIMINAGEDTYDLFNVKAEACFPRLMESDGCAKTNSYINQFYQKFWLDIVSDWDQLQTILDDDEFYEQSYNFYEKYQDQFVTVYASTNVGEDITESWTFFVLSDKPSGGGISQQKILFFYDYPELVDLRKHIRNGL